MNKNTTILNIITTIADAVVCAVAVVAFFLASRWFDRWWVMLFSIIPLILYNAHGIIVEESVEQGDGDAR